MKKKTGILFIFFGIGIIILIALGIESMINPSSKKDHIVIIQTHFGDIHLILFDDTPLHKRNFLKLAREGFYDSTIFHRVIDNFMIQGGDPNSKPDGNINLVGQR